MPLPSSLNELTCKPYADQAKWYLNGFWAEGAKDEAEKVWKVTHKFIELDPKKADGNELDELEAHKLLESQGQSLTVLELRNVLKAIDMDKNGKMGLLEYLLHSYGKTIEACLKSPQGSNQDEIDKAMVKLQAVQDAYTQVRTQLEAQQKALAAQKAAEEQAGADSEASTKAAAAVKADEDAAKQAEASAKSQLDAQKKAEDLVKNAENELKAAIDELKAQEDGYKAQLDALSAKANDPSLTVIAKNKAANELATLKGQDNSGLTKAKKSQETVLKKISAERAAAEKATGTAAEAHAAAEAAAKTAEESRKNADAKASAASGSSATAAAKRKELEEQTKRVEQAEKETDARSKEASAWLEEQKKKEVIPNGAIWWMEREIEESKRYIPQSKHAYM